MFGDSVSGLWLPDVCMCGLVKFQFICGDVFSYVEHVFIMCNVVSCILYFEWYI
jgi:hypothetical protein